MRCLSPLTCCEWVVACWFVVASCACAAGYAVGFFQGVFSIAYGSDYIMDIIPCDVVASVTIAAAAKAASVRGSPAAAEVPVYHACSGHCHPVSLGMIFDANARFWKANPPPLVLPGTK